MANENKKDFNAMMNNQKDMPKITEIKDAEGIKKWGGKTLVVAPALDYNKYMLLVPKGKVTTTTIIRKKIAQDYGVDVCCPLTAGIFTNICAWASFQRTTEITPYWRTLKTDGELNEKYPGGVLAQKEKLESEGFIIEARGKKVKKFYVKDFDKYIKEF